eukprot:GHUV01048853.1.p1 GENE.GHUV01048853.1~~GHUV01048853.1.p1  ORF type:complete len:125 (+),score=37.69 GHUV01048853.1:446-820(+)
MALLVRHGWWDRLQQLMRSLDKTADAKHITAAVSAFRRAGKYDAAKEGLLKLEDIPGLLQLNVEEERWDDAFLLQTAHSQLKEQVYIPYAKWLLSRDRYAHAAPGACCRGACASCVTDRYYLIK